jgi:hypothetical protein
MIVGCPFDKILSVTLRKECLNIYTYDSLDSEALHFVKEVLCIDTHYPTHKIVDTLSRKCNATHREVGCPMCAEQHRLNASARLKFVKLRNTMVEVFG